MLLWLFLGSFGCNLMWAADHLKSTPPDEKDRKVTGVIKGSIITLLLGPITVVMGIRRLFKAVNYDNTNP